MACKTRFSLLAQALIFGVLMAMAMQVVAKRDIPKSAKETDVKHPDTLVTIEPQPTVLVPGMGRYLLPPKPKCKKLFKPLYPYNPITGEPLTGGPISGQIPVGGGQGTGGRTQIPGGDDTFVPNPGYEVPAPGNGSGTGTSPGASSGAGTGAGGDDSSGTGAGAGVPPVPHP